MSLRQVRNPHMKNKVVTTAKAAVYEAELWGADVVLELLGATIAMALMCTSDEGF